MCTRSQMCCSTAGPVADAASPPTPTHQLGHFAVQLADGSGAPVQEDACCLVRSDAGVIAWVGPWLTPTTTPVGEVRAGVTVGSWRGSRRVWWPAGQCVMWTGGRTKSCQVGSTMLANSLYSSTIMHTCGGGTGPGTRSRHPSVAP